MEKIFIGIIILSAIFTYLTWVYLAVPMGEALYELDKYYGRKSFEKEEREKRSIELLEKIASSTNI